MYKVTLARNKSVECETLKECSIAVSKFIDDNCLGSSAFYGGRITQNGKSVAWVSYNGRVWKSNPAKNHSDNNEIIV